MDTTFMLGPLKFSLRTTFDYHGTSTPSDHYTAFINRCKNIATTTKLRSLKLLIAKLLYCIFYTLWIHWLMRFWLEQEGGSLIIPVSLAHPLHPINSRSRNKRRNLWVGWRFSSWWPLFPPRNSVLIYIYLYVCILYTSSVIGRIYTYTRCAVQCQLSCAPSQSIRLLLGSARLLCWMPLVVFFGFTNCASFYDK